MPCSPCWTGRAMSDRHDDFCGERMPAWCDCDLIARVVERERENTSVRSDVTYQRVRRAVAEEIAQAIEADCPHGHLVGHKQVCYRCQGAAAIARRHAEAQP